MAGNSNSGRRPGGKDFAPRVRSSIDRALEKLEDTGEADTLLMAAFRDDFVGTLQKMAAYAPKVVDMSLETTVSVDTTQLSQAILQEMFAEKEKRDTTQPSDRQIH